MSLISSYYIWKDSKPTISFFAMSLFIGAIVVPSITLYGLPVTLLAERWTSKLSRVKQSIFSLFIHVVFGAGFVLILGLFLDPRGLFTEFSVFWAEGKLILISSVSISILVWAVDEAMKSYSLKKAKRDLAL